jgi:Spy/CpxP family protein refolding chaperone
MVSVWHGRCSTKVKKKQDFFEGRDRMSKMKKIIGAVVPILFSVLISTNLFAVDYVRGKVNMQREAAGHYDKKGELALFAKLNLTNEQKARIEAIREAQLAIIKPFHEQILSKRSDLKLLWLQPNPDKGKILSAQKEIRGIRDQIEDATITYRVDVFNVLTPEQQVKAKEVLGKRGAGNGMENRQKMGHGEGMMAPGQGMMGTFNSTPPLYLPGEIISPGAFLDVSNIV